MRYHAPGAGGGIRERAPRARPEVLPALRRARFVLRIRVGRPRLTVEKDLLANSPSAKRKTVFIQPGDGFHSYSPDSQRPGAGLSDALVLITAAPDRASGRAWLLPIHDLGPLNPAPEISVYMLSRAPASQAKRPHADGISGGRDGLDAHP